VKITFITSIPFANSLHQLTEVKGKKSTWQVYEEILSAFAMCHGNTVIAIIPRKVK